MWIDFDTLSVWITLTYFILFRKWTLNFIFNIFYPKKLVKLIVLYEKGESIIKGWQVSDTRVGRIEQVSLRRIFSSHLNLKWLCA